MSKGSMIGMLVLGLVAVLAVGLFWWTMEPMSMTDTTPVLAIDCEIIRQAGPMIWSSNLDDVPVQPDGLDVQHLRSVADDCGYPQSMWLATPSVVPSATFSPLCTTEIQQYNMGQSDPERAMHSATRLRECLSELRATATAVAQP